MFLCMYSYKILHFILIPSNSAVKSSFTPFASLLITKLLVCVWARARSTELHIVCEVGAVALSPARLWMSREPLSQTQFIELSSAAVWWFRAHIQFSLAWVSLCVCCSAYMSRWDLSCFSVCARLSYCTYMLLLYNDTDNNYDDNSTPSSIKRSRIISCADFTPLLKTLFWTEFTKPRLTHFRLLHFPRHTKRCAHCSSIYERDSGVCVCVCMSLVSFHLAVFSSSFQTFNDASGITYYCRHSWIWNAHILFCKRIR